MGAARGQVDLITASLQRWIWSKQTGNIAAQFLQDIFSKYLLGVWLKATWNQMVGAMPKSAKEMMRISRDRRFQRSAG